eukprot:jgi/Mesen1/9245/ME000006S09244
MESKKGKRKDMGSMGKAINEGTQGHHKKKHRKKIGRMSGSAPDPINGIDGVPLKRLTLEEKADLRLKTLQKFKSKRIDWVPLVKPCPVYYPTVEEFKDPLAYISLIQPEASKYGICKIIPPVSASVAASTVLTKERHLRFATRVQALRLNYWDSRDQASFRISNRTYTLPEYEKLANQFAMKQFKTTAHMSERHVEVRFWEELAKEKASMVEYGSDVEGTAFSSSSLDPLGCSNWNLQKLPKLDKSLLRLLPCVIPGVTDPMLYIGMLFSMFCWHVEDHYLYSINYQHMGACKTWYGVPGGAARDFERVVADSVYDRAMLAQEPEGKELKLLLGKTTMFPPGLLLERGVPVFRAVQAPGEFVVTFPRSYHAGFSHGFNCGEAVNFGMADWLPYGAAACRRYALLQHPPLLSHEDLLCREALALHLHQHHHHHRHSSTAPDAVAASAVADAAAAAEAAAADAVAAVASAAAPDAVGGERRSSRSNDSALLLVPAGGSRPSLAAAGDSADGADGAIDVAFDAGSNNSSINMNSSNTTNSALALVPAGGALGWQPPSVAQTAAAGRPSAAAAAAEAEVALLGSAEVDAQLARCLRVAFVRQVSLPDFLCERRCSLCQHACHLAHIVCECEHARDPICINHVTLNNTCTCGPRRAVMVSRQLAQLEDVARSFERQEPGVAWDAQDADVDSSVAEIITLRGESREECEAVWGGGYAGYTRWAPVTPWQSAPPVIHEAHETRDAPKVLSPPLAPLPRPPGAPGRQRSPSAAAEEVATQAASTAATCLQAQAEEEAVAHGTGDEATNGAGAVGSRNARSACAKGGGGGGMEGRAQAGACLEGGRLLTPAGVQPVDDSLAGSGRAAAADAAATPADEATAGGAEEERGGFKEGAAADGGAHVAAPPPGATSKLGVAAGQAEAWGRGHTELSPGGGSLGSADVTAAVAAADRAEALGRPEKEKEEEDAPAACGGVAWAEEAEAGPEAEAEETEAAIGPEAEAGVAPEAEAEAGQEAGHKRSSCCPVAPLPCGPASSAKLVQGVVRDALVERDRERGVFREGGDDDDDCGRGGGEAEDECVNARGTAEAPAGTAAAAAEPGEAPLAVVQQQQQQQQEGEEAGAGTSQPKGGSPEGKSAREAAARAEEQWQQMGGGSPSASEVAEGLEREGDKEQQQQQAAVEEAQAAAVSAEAGGAGGAGAAEGGFQSELVEVEAEAGAAVGPEAEGAANAEAGAKTDGSILHVPAQMLPPLSAPLQQQLLPAQKQQQELHEEVRVEVRGRGGGEEGDEGEAALSSIVSEISATYLSASPTGVAEAVCGSVVTTDSEARMQPEGEEGEREEGVKEAAVILALTESRSVNVLVSSSRGLMQAPALSLASTPAPAPTPDLTPFTSIATMPSTASLPWLAAGSVATCRDGSGALPLDNVATEEEGTESVEVLLRADVAGVAAACAADLPAERALKDDVSTDRALHRTGGGGTAAQAAAAGVAPAAKEEEEKEKEEEVQVTTTTALPLEEEEEHEKKERKECTPEEGVGGQGRRQSARESAREEAAAEDLPPKSLRPKGGVSFGDEKLVPAGRPAPILAPACSPAAFKAAAAALGPSGAVSAAKQRKSPRVKQKRKRSLTKEEASEDKAPKKRKRRNLRKGLRTGGATAGRGRPRVAASMAGSGRGRGGLEPDSHSDGAAQDFCTGRRANFREHSPPRPCNSGGDETAEGEDDKEDDDDEDYRDEDAPRASEDEVSETSDLEGDLGGRAGGRSSGTEGGSYSGENQRSAFAFPQSTGHANVRAQCIDRLQACEESAIHPLHRSVWLEVAGGGPSDRSRE